VTYRQELDSLGRHLAVLSATPHQMDGPEMDVASAGFTATAQLLRRVHYDLVGSGPGIPLLIASLERPVPLLGRLLRDLPDLPQTASPSELLSTPSAGVAGAHWCAVIRSATLAAHYWDTADPDTKPRAAAVHTEIAQIAALAEGLAAVGQDLEGHLRAAGREWDSARLRTANLTALGIVASTARRAALSRVAGDVTQAANPSPSGPVADIRPIPPQLVLTILRPSQLADGLRRLDSLLRSADHLTPPHLRLVTRAVATAASESGRSLHAAGHLTPATEVLQHARLLTDVVRSAGGVASIWPGDQRPLAQAQQLHLHLASIRRANTVLDPRDAWAVAQALPAVTAALQDTTSRMIITRVWVQRSTDSEPLWQPTRRGVETPAVLHRLITAADHADQLRAAVTLDVIRCGETAEGKWCRVGEQGRRPRPGQTTPTGRPTPSTDGPRTASPTRPGPKR
jgi:hypothetical protein